MKGFAFCGLVMLGLTVQAQPVGTVEIPAEGTAVVRAESIDIRKFQPAVDPVTLPRYRGEKVEKRWTIESLGGNTFQPMAPERLLPSPPARPLINMNGIGYSLSLPPDPELAVGPRHIVSSVNIRLAFFDKYSGVKSFEQGLGVNGFFDIPSNVGSYLSDPKLAYDPGSQRFYLTVLDVRNSSKTSYLHLAVSKTSDPNDGWHKYAIRTDFNVNGITHWLDYPMLGFSKSGLVVSGNCFAFGSGNGYGTRSVAIRKSSILNGGNAVVTFFNEPNAYGVQPMRHLDTTVDRVYAMAVRYTTALQVYCFQNLGGTPTMVKLSEPPASNPKVLFVPEMISPAAAPSKGGRFLDALDSRLSFCWYRNGMLYVAHGVRVSAADTRSQVRWYEVDLRQWPVGSTTPTVRQRSSLTGGTGQAQFIPAIAVNGDGDTSMIFTRSSQNIVADLMTAHRKASDPINTFGTPSTMASSEGTFYSNRFNPSSPARWGDYFGLQVDPVDQTTFWVCAMLGGATVTEPDRWVTKIISYNVRPGTTKTYAVRLINRIFGGTPTGVLRDAQTADNVYFTIPAGGTPTRAVARYTFRVPEPRSRTSGMNFVIEAAGGSNGILTVKILNRRTGQYETLGTSALQPTDIRANFRFNKHFPDYFDALGDVIIEATASGSTPFQFKTDFTALQVDRV